jgi:hypothetical protein
MTETTVSVRVDKNLHNQMKLHEEINWSAVLRKSIVEQLEAAEHIDTIRAKHAAEGMDRLRKTSIFDKGRPSLEIIREWREKRK